MPITDEQITRYCACKEEAKCLERELKKLNDAIKNSMVDAGQKEVHTDEYTIELEIRTKEDVDQFKLLMVLKKYWAENRIGEDCPFIKTVEVVDEDALEKFIYQNSKTLPKELFDAMDKCITRKVTKALTYKERK